MKADDHTGNSWMTAFDDQAIQLLGQEAGEVQKMKEASESSDKEKTYELPDGNIITDHSRR